MIRRNDWTSLNGVLEEYDNAIYDLKNEISKIKASIAAASPAPVSPVPAAPEVPAS